MPHPLGKLISQRVVKCPTIPHILPGRGGGETIQNIIFKSIEDIPKMLLDCNHNWFEFIDRVLSKYEDMSLVSKSLYDTISKALDEEQLHLVRQSYYAFCTDEEQTYKQNHTARAINGEIISESESDDSEAYIGVICAASSEVKVLVMKKRKAIRRRAKRKQEKF